MLSNPSKDRNDPSVQAVPGKEGPDTLLLSYRIEEASRGGEHASP